MKPDSNVIALFGRHVTDQNLGSVNAAPIDTTTAHVDPHADPPTIRLTVTTSAGDTAHYLLDIGAAVHMSDMIRLATEHAIAHTEEP